MLYSEEIVKKRLPIMLTSWENLRIINMENWQFATGKSGWRRIAHETLESHIRTVLASFALATTVACAETKEAKMDWNDRTVILPSRGKQSTLPTMFQKIML